MAQFTSLPTLRAQPNSDPSLEDGYHFLISGEFGTIFEVEKTDDWKGWYTIGYATNIFGTVQFDDASARNQPQQFYRATISY
jgi:hypothetical protein